MNLSIAQFEEKKIPKKLKYLFFFFSFSFQFFYLCGFILYSVTDYYPFITTVEFGKQIFRINIYGITHNHYFVRNVFWQYLKDNSLEKIKYLNVLTFEVIN